jgi:1-acyl-sn-glycerol-3-phosphate acyltransferase
MAGRTAIVSVGECSLSSCTGHFMAATSTDITSADGFFSRIVRAGFAGWFNTAGWKIVGDVILPKKMVLVAAPHTSNWDFPLALAVGAHYRLKINFVAKNTLFRWPFGGLMRWLGGVSVDRSKRSDAVATMIAAFAARDEIHLVIAPAGTRDDTIKWKSGFYHIAVGAGVPLAFAYVDYARKQAGIGEVFQPTGDYEADMAHILNFYSDKSGRQAARAKRR